MTLEERLKKDNSKGLTIEERVKKNRYTTSEDNSDVDLKTRYLSSIGSSEKIEPYKSVMANEDFAEKSKYVAEGGYEPWNDIKNAISAIKGDQATNRSLYENINEPVSKNPFKNAGKAITEYLTGTNPYSMLTDEEKALYNYYYNTGDYETAQNLYRDIIEEIPDRVRQYQGVRANEQVDNLGDTMLVWPETVLPNVASGLAQVTTGGLAGLATAAQGEGFAKGWNDFAKSNFVGSNVDALRSAGGQYLGEKTGTKIIPEAYQAAMSVLDSIVTANLAMGVAGSEKASKMVKALTKLPMSGNAARAKAIEVLDRGGTETEAALSSVASGVWEYLTESIGTDAMFDILTGKINAKTAKEFIVRALLASSGAEAAEEGLSDLGNLITDFLTMDLNNEGTESELMQRYHKYLKIGFDDVTAKGIAFIMFVDDTLTDMLGGALGGLFGAGIEIPSGLKRYNSYGKSILQNENVPQLAEQLEKEGRTDIATTIKENPTKLNVGFAQDTLINNAIEKATAKNATEADYNKYVQTMNEASRNLLPKTGITDKKGNILHLENIIWEGDTPTFVTKEGTFNAKDVNVSDSTNHMISFTENLPEASRKAFVENYNGENLGDYVNKFVLIYDTGKRGLTKDLQRYIEDGLFPKETVYNIYNAALSDASSVTSQLEREKMRIATRRELYRDKQVRAIVDDSNIDLTKLTDNQKDGIRFTSQIAKGFNVNVVYYDSNTTNKAELKNANGEYYDPTNTIFLDINAKNTGTDSAENAIVTAMSHELTHWAKALSPEFWFSFRKNTLGTLTDEYNKDNGTNFSISEFVEYMHKVTPNYKGKSTEKVEEELICRACENMLQNSDFAYATIKQMTKDEQQKLGDKIKDLIDKAIQMLRNIMFRSDSGSYMSQLLAKNEETFNELKEQWDEMIKTAAENSAYLNAELQGNDVDAELVERNFSIKEIVGEKGKENLSIKKDSLGNTLTEDQSIYFAKSVIRDAEGRLLVVYHGTPTGGFTVFRNGLTYFTANKEYAERYTRASSNGKTGTNPQLYSGYLNITKPFTLTDSKAKQIYINEYIKGGYAQGMDPNASDAEINKYAENGIDWTEADNLKDFFDEKGYDYDGIILNEGGDLTDKGTVMRGDSFVTFSQEQFKDRYNKKPTTNPDINLSVKDDESYLSKVDSAGKELTADQQIFYADESPLLKDAEGRLKRYYHGTARMDRVGTVFDPARATSGPMAYFTDDKDIATHYSKDKDDTSLSRDTEYDNYYTQFRININGKDMSISEAWNKLPAAKRNEIARKAVHVTYDWNTYDIIYNESAKNGVGSLDDYTIHQHKGNYLDALVEEWLDNGELLDHEEDFLEVMRLVGLDNVVYKNPNVRNEGVYEVYLHITNPFDTNNMLEEDIEAIREAAKTAKQPEVNYHADEWDKTNITPEAWIKDFNDDVEEGTSYSMTRIPDWVTDVLKARGYDGIVDRGGKYHEKPHQVVIPFSSEQVKSITNEHPTINPDINLSWKDDEGYLHLDFDDELSPADIEKLVNDYKFNKQLNNAIQKRVERREKNRIAKLRQIDREMKLSPTKINDLAKELKETYELPQSIKEISDGLKEVYLKSTEPSFDTAVNELMVKLFKDVKSTYIDYDLKKEADNFKKALHKETITLSENQKKELRNVYGASWHKDHFLGRVSLKSLEKGGTLLDSRWSELVEAYPDLFPDPTDSDAQEGVQLAEVLDLVYSGRLYTSDSLDMTRDMKRTFIEAVKRGKWDVVEDLTMAEKYTEVIGELREKVKQAEGLKKEVEQAKKDVIENAKRRMIADKIIEREVKLSKMLIKNGQKTGEHIPQILEQPLKDILEAVDVGAYVPEKMAKNFVALANALENVSTNHEAEENLEMYFDSSEHFVNQIREIAEELQKKVDDFKDSAGGTVSILDLSTQSLTKLNQTLAAVTMAAHKYDRALASENNARISDRDKSTFEFVGEFTKRGKVANWAKDIITFFAWDNTTPVYGYDRFGKGGKDTFKGIMEGDDQLTRNSEKIINFCKDTFTGEELEQWNKEIHDDVRINRKTYAMTTTQIMTLYCLNRRQAAQQHLYEDQKNVYGETVNGQGIVISANDKSEKTVATTITKGEVTQITNLLTKRQKEVAEKLQEFMSTVCSDWGNYVTFKRFGILQFEEDNYFPMNVSQALTEEKPTPGGSWRVDVFRLLNMGFTKSLNERGNGALIIDNIFDVFFKHCGEMSAYNAYALPILDAYKWMSYKGKGYSGLNVIQSEDTEKRISFSEVVEQAYGSDGLNFLQSHLRDLNGTKNISSSAESLAKKIIRNYKTAATAANLRVTLMQPTAYFRAANEIDVKYLAKAMTLNPKQIKASVERMNENSTLAQKKNGLGAFDVNVSRSIAEQAMQTDKVSGLKGIVQKAKAASMWFAMKADEITWGTLYHAVELEMKDKAPNLDNVEYKRLVEERFRDICYRTQVFDSINARSNLMRKTSDTYLGILTAFGSEPTLSYSMLVNNVFMYTIDARDGNKQRAWKRYGKKIGRAFAAYLMSAVAVSAVAALPDWMRDDEEDDGFLKKYFKQFGLNLLSEPLGLLPYLRDIPDIFKGYNPSRPDEEIIKTLKQFGSSAVKAIQDGELSYRTIYQAAKLFSQATGLPLANVIRDVKSLWNKTIGEVFDMKIQ